MRIIALTAVLLAPLAPLAGCIQLPAEVAAVVRESDPPARNNFLPETPPETAATRAEPAPH